MDRKNKASEELNCPTEELDSFGPNRGTVYDDGESDWTETFTDRSTGISITVYEYAHDPELRVGFKKWGEDKTTFRCLNCGKASSRWGARILTGWVCSNECLEKVTITVD